MTRPALALAALLALSGCGYNQIQTLDEQAESFKGQIAVQLQRRADLVPNLVEVVKGYARQELEIFETVSNARAALSGAVQGGDIQAMAAANAGLSGALGRLIAIAEDNPEIKSNENFRALQDQLEGTENRIAVSRTDYNNAVKEYNAYIRRFPQVLTAKVTGAGPREYFEAEAAAAEAPKVQF
jgi:LemA protein